MFEGLVVLPPPAVQLTVDADGHQLGVHGGDVGEPRTVAVLGRTEA